jgi:hypothetical protein
VRDLATPTDLLGREQLHRFNFMHLARAIPGYAARFTGRVPPAFQAQVDFGVIEVSCPCGDGPPRCEWMVPTACSCGRVYVSTGRDVRVAYLEDAQPDS